MSLFSSGQDNIISIDIGHKNIKLLEIDISKSDFINIKNYGIAPISEECMKNGQIINLEKIKEAIIRIVNENDIKAKNAKIVMSGNHVISRLIMIDYIPEEELDRNIGELVIKSLPNVSSETHEIDYKIIDSVNRENLKYHKLFLTAVPKSAIKSYIDVIIAIGLKPLSVDIPAYSISKFFKRNINKEVPASEGEDTFAVVDFGAQITSVNIIRNKNIEFNKAILRGSMDIDKGISRAIFRMVSEAEAIKKKYGLLLPEYLNHEEQAAIQQPVSAIIDEIAEQIIRCFEFYNNKCNGPRIGYMHIIGGGSLLKGLKEYLEQRFRIPVFSIEYSNVEGIKIDTRLNSEKINCLINASGIALD